MTLAARNFCFLLCVLICGSLLLTMAFADDLIAEPHADGSTLVTSTCFNLAKDTAQAIDAASVSGRVLCSSELFPRSASKNSDQLLCACSIRLVDSSGFTASRRIRVVPVIKDQLLSPWIVILPAHTQNIFFLIPLNPVKSLAVWRGGRRTNPKPIDRGSVSKIELRFVGEEPTEVDQSMLGDESGND